MKPKKAFKAYCYKIGNDALKVDLRNFYKSKRF